MVVTPEVLAAILTAFLELVEAVEKLISLLHEHTGA